VVGRTSVLSLMHRCDARVDAFSAPGEVLVLYHTSLNQRRGAVFSFGQTDVQTDASHHTEVNDGEPVARTPLTLALFASQIARLVVHSPHRLLARCSTQAGL
jgi:hypothetical protein